MGCTASTGASSEIDNIDKKNISLAQPLAPKTNHGEMEDSESDLSVITPMLSGVNIEEKMQQTVASEFHHSHCNLRLLYWNFVRMSIAFSLNHGTVTSCLAYTTAQLGNDLGSLGSGCLYIAYSFTSFFLSKPLVTMVGPRKGLLIGVAGYCIYVLGFLWAALFPLVSYPVFIISAIIGGIAGGILWTAQGRYFARNAKLYSNASEVNVEDVNSLFAGIFSASYLGLEMISKGLATVIFLYSSDATFIVFTVYSAIALASCFIMASVFSLDEPGNGDFQLKTILTNSLASAWLVVSDMRLALLIPLQIAFGFAFSFVPYYVFGTIVGTSPSLGKTWVGLLSAVIVFTGAVIALPTAKVTNAIGKPIVMVVGGICLALSGLIFFIVSDNTLGTWNVIIPYLVVYGIARSCYENTNKAVVADFFNAIPDSSTSAFAIISFANGLSGSIGYFAFSKMTRLEIAGLVTATSVVAIMCYLVAVKIHQMGMGKNVNVMQASNV